MIPHKDVFLRRIHCNKQLYYIAYLLQKHCARGCMEIVVLKPKHCRQNPHGFVYIWKKLNNSSTLIEQINGGIICLL